MGALKHALVLVAALALGLPASVAAQPGHAKLDRALAERASRPAGWSRVIVRMKPGKDASGALRKVSGIAGARLASIGARVAEVNDARLAALAADPDVLSVHADRPLVATLTTPTTTAGAAVSVHGVTGFDGAGVGIAVLDSGVAAHTDLGRSGPSATALQHRISGFVDFVGGRPQLYDDYGHGTHVAGILAGNGALSDGSYAGLAPGAHLLVLKVLDGQGRGTVSDAIRALEYVVANRARHKVRIINLSVGAGVYESYLTDPFTLAARQAVDAGIVVVAAAGNFGKDAAGNIQYGAITAPGNAPWVLTVGAYTTLGTPETADDRVAGYSSRGPTAIDFAAKPDIVAPGTRIVSLASADSLLASTRPADLVAGTSALPAWPYFTLSGTSMAAPAVAGAAALMLQANPALTPNAVKALIQYTSKLHPEAGLLEQGAGFLNVSGAVEFSRFFATVKPGDRVRLPDSWSRHILWGNYRLRGGVILPGGTAWATNIVWGSLTTLNGDNIVWGSACDPQACDNIVWGSGDDNIVWGSGDLENIVWGSGDDDNIVWGSGDDDNIVWGSGEDDNIVWGSADDNIVWGSGDDNIVWGSGDDNIVWGSNDDNIVWGSGDDNIVWGSDVDNIVWGSQCDGDDCDNIVWGSDGENIVWGSDGENIVWGSGDGDNIVWGSGGDNIVWGSTLAVADGEAVAWPGIGARASLGVR